MFDESGPLEDAQKRQSHDYYGRSTWDTDVVRTPMTSAFLGRLESVGRLFLALLAFSLPYETVVFAAGPLQVSSLEILLALVLLCTVALVVSQKRWRKERWLRFPRSWLVLWALFALALLLSTALAPEHRLNAAKASARLLSGMVLALCAPQILRRPRQLLWVIVPLLLGGLLSVSAGLVEVWQGQALGALDAFRVSPTSVGPFIRLTGSFDHANQAAMFLEATVPLLVVIVLVVYKRRGSLAFAPALVTLLWLQALISTYSRTALVAVFASSMAVALLLWSRRLVLSGRLRSLWDHLSQTLTKRASVEGSTTTRFAAGALPWAVVAVALVALVALNALFDPVMRMRFTSEGDNEWYNLSFDAPQALAVEAGHTVTTTITVHNEGDLTWSSSPPAIIHVGGHWYLPEQDISLAYEPRWQLPRAVAPGESVTMQVNLQAPLYQGTYQFRWDLIQEGVLWFSYKNGVRTRTSVTVEETDEAVTPLPETELALSQLVEAPPDLAPIPDRRTLWRIAAQEFRQRPLLGIGMDNFRLIYGRALDYEQWNDTIHTNNWYIELLVSLGLLGALPFFAWMALVGLGILVALRRRRVTLWHAALAAGLLAYFLHGALDYFLSANATAMLFWLLAGLWVVVEAEPRAGV